MKWNAEWIKTCRNMKDVSPVFFVDFSCLGVVKSAVLRVTALGVYEAMINDKRVGSFVLAPGWTVYKKRLQVQEYDVTDMIAANNRLEICVGKGWYRSPLVGWIPTKRNETLDDLHVGLTAELVVELEDGSNQIICTDETWSVAESQVRFSEIYDGEVFDASFVPAEIESVEVFDGPTEILISQQGEEICEQERLAVAKSFKTPKGELVIDFGQEITGYVETTVCAKAGDHVQLSFAEMMDEAGNFLTENYRSAKSQYIYVCRDGKQTYKPKMTFHCFRYIRVDDFPGGVEEVKAENFTAIVVHSQMERIGYIKSSNSLLNKLMENIIWGQKCNFLDVPTDCPQRDERLGWTGDAQVFARTACLNFDVEKFYTKWLADMIADQKEDGMVGHVIPNVLDNELPSAGWADAATICPWQVYLAYGNKEILENQYECMEKWVCYITEHTTTPYIWTGGQHFGDWLALDAAPGRCMGASNTDLIATTYYAHSTELLIKAGKVLGKDISKYEVLYKKIIAAFREYYKEYKTQTECIMAAHFRMAKEPKKAADQLADMIRNNGNKLQTGFIGTPYILHVLSDFGYLDLAYELLLRTRFPSWLYPVTKGATTVWEHWDGIMENGELFRVGMNSFNHYAYGAVADWIYCQAAGIQTVEEYPGYEKVRIEPLPNERLDWLEGVLKTRHGQIRSYWQKQDNEWRYEIDTPVEATIVIKGMEYQVQKGRYVFYSTK